jgi:hypothetical protein
MDLATFTDGLRRLSDEDIRRCATGLDPDQMSVSEEVLQWRAELGIERLLRTHGSRAEAQRANAAGHRAAVTVVEAARLHGLELPHPDVTRVARAASQIARGLVVNGTASSLVQIMLCRWERALSAARRPVLTAA